MIAYLQPYTIPDERDCEGHPTPDDIQRLTAEIREGWTPRERRKRAMLAESIELMPVRIELVQSRYQGE